MQQLKRSVRELLVVSRSVAALEPAHKQLSLFGGLLALFLIQNIQLAVCRSNQDDGPSELAPATATAPQVQQPQATTPSSPSTKEPAECAVFADYGKNYLTPIDILVKNKDSDTACIKARFALSIKVEEANLPNSQEHQNQSLPVSHPVLGYVPLEHVIAVEESCPEEFNDTSNTDPNAMDAKVAPDATNITSAQDERSTDDHKKQQEEELEMIVTFDCGKLSFTFKRDKTKVYVSSIKGVVKLDRKVVREFYAVRPMFLTSDLNHHFKHDDLIEVVSEVQSKVHILTANFYFTEFEAFRKTCSRDFVKPPDAKSKPFSDEADDQPAKERTATVT